MGIKWKNLLRAKDAAAMIVGFLFTGASHQFFSHEHYEQRLENYYS